MRSLLAILCVGVTAAACSAGRPDFGDPLSSHLGAVPLYTPAGEISRLPERATHRGDSNPLRNRNDATLQVLVISGGGSAGAFGAGLLKGWSQSGSRPSFDIVTGISTGALIAPFAFVGSDHDDQLTSLYTETSDADVYNSRGTLGVFQDSLNETSPLGARLDKIITDELLDRIAAEHAKGRRLYVGTTDLDTGEAVTWDLGGISAGEGGNRRKRVAQILLASASVPGLFNPVYIETGDGKGAHMHVDGGVKAPILLRDFMLAGNYRSKRVYIVINNCICLRNIKQPVDPRFVDITRKSIDEMMRTFLYRALETSYIMARHAGAQYSLHYIPDDIPLPDTLDFKPEEMRQLFEVGRSLGSTPTTWHHAPPRMQRFLNAVDKGDRAPRR